MICEDFLKACANFGADILGDGTIFYIVIHFTRKKIYICQNPPLPAYNLSVFSCDSKEKKIGLLWRIPDKDICDAIISEGEDLGKIDLYACCTEFEEEILGKFITITTHPMLSTSF